MADLVVAVDSGTTSCRALAFDSAGAVVAIAQQEFTQHFPFPGWVEHDADEIARVQIDVLTDVVRAVGANRVAAIGITNQRETVVVWDKKSGRPLSRAIVWQCRRTAERCRELENAGCLPTVRLKTGLLLDAYFSATKMSWLRENVDGVRQATDSGDAVFGTIDSWLIYRLTDGATLATDTSNASRTLLMELHSCHWDPQLCELFDIPLHALPEIRPSDGGFGVWHCDGFEIPIAAVLGDQQAALFGQGCTAPGDAKCTYGTGAFLLMNAGDMVPTPPPGLLATVAWTHGERTTYAIEGSVFVAGAAVQWLRDGLGLIESAAETDALARSVADTGGVYFVPAFAGLGAPHWNPDARGLICGLTRGTTRAHLVRAALEGIAFQVGDVFDAMSDAGNLARPDTPLRVDGGASRNDFLLQFQADLLNRPIQRPRVTEVTAWGAARLAAEAIGLWPPANIATAIERTFTPVQPEQTREALWQGWRNAVKLQG